MIRSFLASTGVALFPLPMRTPLFADRRRDACVYVNGEPAIASRAEGRAQRDAPRRPILTCRRRSR